MKELMNEKTDVIIVKYFTWNKEISIQTEKLKIAKVS